MAVKRVYLVGVICLQDFVVYYALNLSIFIKLICLRKVKHDKFFVFYFQFAYIR